MEEKLTKLYNECIEELKSIGINMEDSKKKRKNYNQYSQKNSKKIWLL